MIQMRMNQPCDEGEDCCGSGNGGDTAQEDLHGGGIIEEAVAGRPGDFCTGLNEEAELDC